MTHHRQMAPSPTSCSTPAWRAWDHLAWLLRCSKPAWERLPEARLALMQLSCPCPPPGAGTGLKGGKQPHISSRCSSKKQTGHLEKSSPLAWHSAGFPNLPGGHCPGL